MPGLEPCAVGEQQLPLVKGNHFYLDKNLISNPAPSHKMCTIHRNTGHLTSKMAPL